MPENNGVKERVDDRAPEIIRELFSAPYRYFSFLFWDMGYKEMLDIGCGSGNGTRLMRSYFKKVIGVDKDIIPLDDFIAADVSDLHQFADKSVDGLFCFEVIEHLDEEKQKKLIDEIVRVCRKGFVIGSINRLGPDKIEGVEIFKGEKNPYHVKEFDKPELKEILQPLREKDFIYEPTWYGSRYNRRNKFVQIAQEFDDGIAFSNYYLVELK
jgi:SAM-dependent methyltransferase